jgi:hypothetical protein
VLRIAGNAVAPSISIGVAPAKAARSSSTGCGAAERLATIKSVSRPCRRRYASTFELRGRRNSMLPRPNTDEVRRAARSCRIVFSKDDGWRVCAATFTAS